jgi:chain length determinant protein (polysaccharide antigen chain regulator)
VNSNIIDNKEEIDLLFLWHNLIRYKWILILTIGFCSTISMIIVSFLPYEYKAEMVLLPPTKEMVAPLSIPQIDKENGSTIFFQETDPQELYQRLLVNLKSRQLVNRYFVNNDLIKSLSKKEESLSPQKFAQKIAVSPSNKQINNNFIRIYLKGNNPSIILKLLNGFVTFVAKETTTKELHEIAFRINQEKDRARHMLTNLDEIEQLRKSNQITRLNTALAIAKKLGFVEPLSTSVTISEESLTTHVYVHNGLNTIDQPLYYRGTKLLKTEIEFLKQQKEIIDHQPEYYQVYKRYLYFSSIKLNSENVHAMRIDQLPVIRSSPVKHKKNAIIIIGLCVGILLSLSMIFILNIKNNRTIN